MTHLFIRTNSCALLEKGTSLIHKKRHFRRRCARGQVMADDAEKSNLRSVALQKYILDVSVFPREHKQLKEIRHATVRKYGERSAMSIPADEGMFLSMLLKVMNAKKTLEIGVFTGYSLLTTALALPDDGQVTAVDTDLEAFQVGLPFIREAGVENKINFIHSDALSILNKLLADSSSEKRKSEFDFIFIDADKTNYLRYFEPAIKLVKIGGIIAFDNTLWHGFVALDESKVPDGARESAMAMRDLNKFLASDPRIEISHVSIGDGVTLCRRLR